MILRVEYFLNAQGRFIFSVLALTSVYLLRYEINDLPCNHGFAG